MGNLITDAVVIAIVIFATNVSLAKTFANRNNYVIDSNQVSSAGEWIQIKPNLLKIEVL